jgi:argonaute-like protein implicated in RNA metabolism and viral defense
MSCIIPRGRWRHIIVLNIHVSTENKINDVKDRFYEELERVFEKFPKYLMKILLEDFNVNVDRKYIFKTTIEN